MENEEIICRYCLSYEDKETLIYPCLCKTPVHRECLNEWLKMKYNDKQCEICLEEYKGINYNNKNKIIIRIIFLILAISGFIFLAYINNYLEEEAKPIFQLIVMIYTTVILILFLIDFIITFVPNNSNEYNTMEIR